LLKKVMRGPPGPRKKDKGAPRPYLKEELKRIGLQETTAKEAQRIGTLPEGEKAKAYNEEIGTMTKPNARARPLAEVSRQRARLAKAQADIAEQKAARQRGSLLDAAEVENEWSGVLRTVRAGMLAVPSRVAQRLPHLTPHDIAEIDREVRAALSEIAS
jgi:phage terminase Nu1 subunit (DNA packaging protein)